MLYALCVRIKDFSENKKAKEACRSCSQNFLNEDHLKNVGLGRITSVNEIEDHRYPCSTRFFEVIEKLRKKDMESIKIKWYHA